MNGAIDIAVAVVGAYGPICSLVLSLPDAAEYQRAFRERQLERKRALGPVRWLRRVCIRLVLMAACFGYAYARAALPYFWGAAAIIFGTIALVGISMSFTEAVRTYQFEDTPPSELQLASSRRRIQVGQILYAVLWIGCWWPQLRLAG